jgi:hypothetical protein
MLSGFVLDKEDNSVTRSDPYFRELFKKCGLYIHNIKVCISQNLNSTLMLNFLPSIPAVKSCYLITEPKGIARGTIRRQNVCIGDQ